MVVVSARAFDIARVGFVVVRRSRSPSELIVGHVAAIVSATTTVIVAAAALATETAATTAEVAAASATSSWYEATAAATSRLEAAATTSTPTSSSATTSSPSSTASAPSPAAAALKVGLHQSPLAPLFALARRFDRIVAKAERLKGDTLLRHGRRDLGALRPNVRIVRRVEERLLHFEDGDVGIDHHGALRRAKFNRNARLAHLLLFVGFGFASRSERRKHRRVARRRGGGVFVGSARRASRRLGLLLLRRLRRLFGLLRFAFLLALLEELLRDAIVLRAFGIGNFVSIGPLALHALRR